MLMRGPQEDPFRIFFVLAVLTGASAAALAGWIVGKPSLRLRGDYLAIVTLGFGEIIRVIIENTPFFGGAIGLSPIPRRADFAWIWAVVIITILIAKGERTDKRSSVASPSSCLLATGLAERGRRALPSAVQGRATETNLAEPKRRLGHFRAGSSNRVCTNDPMTRERARCARAKPPRLPESVPGHHGEQCEEPGRSKARVE